ncbi:hypothetical protein FAP39_17135 [Shimia litoralis]|uniref:Flagellar protein FlgJ N-terminal domain-containing protein n=1 Tax=Shimia litoralis TaxID=420403 RepID=A0A4U7MR77_9RHOB|nr:rod-binding protein [Shimia litoralis]TKZ15460.1 hypothetical protein FAP39_17135 [Shimia litoralis]
MQIPAPPAPPLPQGSEYKHSPAYKAAQELEASFLAEMLKISGLGKPLEGFGGGSGEDQFSSFLVNAQAKEIVKAGGLGLTEIIFESLKEAQDEK